MKKLAAFLLVLVLCVSACAQAEETWTCPNCGEENGAVCAFCENCGAKHAVEWICPVCGKANTKNFCGGCGAAKPENNSGAYKVGDIITFGTWVGVPIKWKVLEDKGDGTYVLLSVYGLDAEPYNTEYTDVTWETCSLRAWLNGEFYESSFSPSEKGKIVLSTVENPDNKKSGTEGGNATQDYVYLLSLDEVGRYFHVNPYGESGDRCAEALLCMPTQTAVNRGAYTVVQPLVDNYQSAYNYPLKAGACWWWLRSPGDGPDDAAGVGGDGHVDCSGNSVDHMDGCVRPVICVRF